MGKTKNSVFSKGSAASKTLAIIVTATLVFSCAGFYAFAQSVTSQASDSSEVLGERELTSQPYDPATQAKVTVLASNVAFNVSGQPILTTKQFIAPLGKDLAFEAVPSDGYAITQVQASSVNGVQILTPASTGGYVVPDYLVADGLQIEVATEPSSFAEVSDVVEAEPPTPIEEYDFSGNEAQSEESASADEPEAVEPAEEAEEAEEGTASEQGAEETADQGTAQGATEEEQAEAAEPEGTEEAPDATEALLQNMSYSVMSVFGIQATTGLSISGMSEPYIVYVGEQVTVKSSKSSNYWSVSPNDYTTKVSSTSTSYKFKVNAAGEVTITQVLSGGRSYSITIQIVDGSATVEAPKVVFDANGGNAAAPADITTGINGAELAEGVVVTLPDYSGQKSGYEFVGWSTASNATGADMYTTPVYPAGSEYTVENGVNTLYATWASSNDTAWFFVRLDGTIPIEPQSHATSEYTKKMEVSNALKLGVFYADSTEGVGKYLNNQPSEEALKAAFKEAGRTYDPQTQYVLWYVIKHADDAWHVDGVLLDRDLVNLSYSPNAPDGLWSNMPDGEQCGLGRDIQISSKVPVRSDGYTFTGWEYTDESGVVQTYEPGDTITMNSNVNLVAQWENTRAIQIKAASDSKNYDGQPLATTTEDDAWTSTGFTVTGGLPEGYTVYVQFGDDPQTETVESTITNAGSVANHITAFKIEDAAGTDVTSDFKNAYATDGTLTVSPQPITITVASLDISYKEAFKPTGAITSGELVNEDDLGEISYGATEEGLQNIVGEHTDALIAEYVPNANYTVTVVPGTLTVSYEAAYGYTVNYLLQGSNTALHEPTNGSAAFGTEIVGNSMVVTIPGYKAVEITPEKLSVSEDASANVINIYYREDANVTITYTATTGGSVSLGFESLAPATGTAQGSTATASAGYHFVNWTNAADVEVSTDAAFLPEKVDGLNVAGTYTANFAENDNVTITYTANTGGSVSREAESLAPATGTAQGSTATASAGYHFVNWTNAADVEVSTNATFLPEKVDGLNVAGAYTANFTEDANVTITYTATTGGSVSLGSESLAPATGTAQGSTATASAGYHFVNWTNAAGKVVSTDIAYVPAKVNGLNVEATYTANFAEDANVTITYRATAGGNVSSASESLKPATGNAQGSTAIASAGYSFVNWTNEAGEEVSTDIAYEPAKVNGLNVEATYTARFEPNNGDTQQTYYIVKHVAGQEVLSTESYTSTAWVNADPVTIEIQSGSLDRGDFPGYEFASINTEAEVGEQILSGSTITLTYVPRTDISYTVNYLEQGTDKKLAEPKTQTNGVFATTVKEDAIPITGYSPVDAQKELELGLENNVINFYYTANTYTLTYVVDDETYSTATYTYGAELSAVPAPTKTGYNFGGWDKTTPATMPANNLTISGAFTPIDYTVTYLLDGAQYGVVDTQHYGDALTLRANPEERAGYTFGGWSEIPATMPAADLTISGAFTPIDYTVTYLLDGAQYGVVDTQHYGDALTLRANPEERAGYTFGGWSEIPATMPAADLTISGTFTENADVTIQYVSADETMGTVSSPEETLPPATGEAAGSTANALTGYSFVNWTNEDGEEVSTSATFSPAKVDGLNVAATYTANFKPDYTVTVPTSYTVQHIVDGDVRDSEVIEGNDWVNAEPLTVEVVEGSLDPREYEGYTFASIDSEAQPGEKIPNETVISLTYEAIPAPPATETETQPGGGQTGGTPAGTVVTPQTQAAAIAALPAPVAAVVDSLAAGGAAMDQIVGDNANPLTQVIDDEGNPLGAFDQVVCWVHFYMILGLIVTLLYGAFVVVRRLLFSRKMDTHDDMLLHGTVEREAAPTTAATREMI